MERTCLPGGPPAAAVAVSLRLLCRAARGLVGVTLLAVLLPPGAAAAAPVAPVRIVVFDIQADGIPGADVSQLPDLIGQIINGHPGYAAVPDDETHRALLAVRDSEPGCELSASCRRRIAHGLHAALTVFGSVQKRDRGYTLYLSLTHVEEDQPPVKTSESMKLLKSLPLNAHICLTRLFHWESESPQAKPAAAGDAKPVSSDLAETVPPIEPEALAPAPASPSPPVPPEPAPASPPASATAPGVARVMVLDVRGVEVDAAAAAPFTSLIAEQIASNPGYEVASADDVRRLQEEQTGKLAGGCAQDEACLVEISRKLNADLVVHGTVGRLGSSYVLALTALRPSDVKRSSRASVTASRIEDLIGQIPVCLRKLLHWEESRTAAFHLPKGKNLAFAVFDLKPTGISRETAVNLTQILSIEVKGVEGASVVSRDDVVALLQLESTRMKAGCDDAGCMAEIGGALGVDRLITGDAGKVGTLFVVNLRLLDVRHGVVENRVTESFEGTEEQLLHAVRVAARNLLGLKTATRGEMAVTASQNAAEVFVDEQTSGKAPAHVVNLLPGKHAVRVEAGGFFDWHGDVYVDPLETTSIWAQLLPRPQAWYQKWWVWTIVGGAIAAATATAVAETQKPARTGTGVAVVQ